MARKTTTVTKEPKETNDGKAAAAVSYFPPKDGIKTNFMILDEIGKLVNPILIEGLPGIGFVGKLAAEHIVEELSAKKVAILYSHHFPHQILINKDGTIKMLTNEIHLYKDPKKKNDLVIIVGDVQPTTSQAQYEVMNIILEFFANLDGKRIITLGGYGVGKLVEKPRVFGAITSKGDIEEYKKHGVSFGEVEGSIIGAAGMLLGLGKLKKMDGICLMGETHGNYIDHKSAQRVIEVLSSIVGVKINTDKLGKKAKESEGVIKKLEEELAKGENPIPQEMPKKKEELSYIR